MGFLLRKNAYISSFGGYIKTASGKRNNTLYYYYLTLLYDNNTLCIKQPAAASLFKC